MLKSERKVVFLPFYGEFGFYIMSHIRWVHHSSAPEKIVCCVRGDECFFPSASSFYYEWQHPFEDWRRCGLRDKYSFKSIAPTKLELDLFKRLKEKYSDAFLAQLQRPIPFSQVHKWPVPVHAPALHIPKVDVVICARHRQAHTHEGDKGMRNFRHWQPLADHLVSRGFTFAVIGNADTSFEVRGATIVNWKHPNKTDVMISLLKQCGLYIGTDTGPTHLAALLGVPMLVFRNPNDRAYNLLERCVSRVAKTSGAHYEEVICAWEAPKLIADKASLYLESAIPVDC